MELNKSERQDRLTSCFISKSLYASLEKIVLSECIRMCRKARQPSFDRDWWVGFKGIYSASLDKSTRGPFIDRLGGLGVNNNNNNDFISIVLFPVKHAQLR